MPLPPAVLHGMRQTVTGMRGHEFKRVSPSTPPCHDSDPGPYSAPLGIASSLRELTKPSRGSPPHHQLLQSLQLSVGRAPSPCPHGMERPLVRSWSVLGAYPVRVDVIWVMSMQHPHVSSQKTQGCWGADFAASPCVDRCQEPVGQALYAILALAPASVSCLTASAASSLGAPSFRTLGRDAV